MSSMAKLYFNIFSLSIFISLISTSSNILIQNETELNLELNKKSSANELRIDIYPENKRKKDLIKESVKNLISRITHNYSFDPNRKLAFISSNVPLLSGFYYAHINHLPIRIRPDDIWLLIVQAFSNHVSANPEKLRNFFVNFKGKQRLEVEYIFDDINTNIKHLPKSVYEDFSEKITNQMKKYIDKKIVENLIPDFSTTDTDSMVVGKLSIMGSFQEYFDYDMNVMIICGSPYMILEGTAEDYQKIIDKAEKLSKYDFEWYIKRIRNKLKMLLEAKKGNVNIDFFKSIIQKAEITEHSLSCEGSKKSNVITGWILKFFAYNNKFERFSGNSIDINKFDELANQMLTVPYRLRFANTKKIFNMNFKVGFIGCDQNEKGEVYPVQGWIASEKEKEKIEYDL